MDTAGSSDHKTTHDDSKSENKKDSDYDDNDDNYNNNLNVVQRKFPRSFDVSLFVSKFEPMLDISKVPSGETIKKFKGSLIPFWNIYNTSVDDSLPIALITFYRDIREIKQANEEKMEQKENNKDNKDNKNVTYEFYWNLQNLRIFNFEYLKHLLKLGVLPFVYSDLIEKDNSNYEETLKQQEKRNNMAKSTSTQPDDDATTPKRM